MAELETRERIISIEQQIKTIFIRIDELKESDKKIFDALEANKELLFELKQLRLDVNKHTEKLEAIEDKPSQHLDWFWKTIGAVVIAALITFIITQLGLK